MEIDQLCSLQQLRRTCEGQVPQFYDPVSLDLEDDEECEHCQMCSRTYEPDAVTIVDGFGSVCQNCLVVTFATIVNLLESRNKQQEKKERILSEEEATSWRDGIDGNHEEIDILIDTITALYRQISVLKNSVVKSNG
jgi:hypothetical protein